MTKTKDIYQLVTDRVLTQLEAGNIPWHKPWVSALAGAGSGSVSSNECAVSYSTGKPYSFTNQMLLDGPGEYATFNQIKEAGGKVKKGAKSQKVVFWKLIPVEEEDASESAESPSEGRKMIPILKYFSVFNIRTDCEGLETKWETPKAASDVPMNDVPADELAEEIVTAYVDGEGVKIQHGVGHEASYIVQLDTIRLPQRIQFDTMEDYYSTLFHELVHSTGHVSRLNRDLTARFGSCEYSREELCAEIGATALCSHCGLNTDSAFDNSVAYIQGWAKRLKDDNRAVVVAAGKAQHAVERILGHSSADNGTEAA